MTFSLHGVGVSRRFAIGPVHIVERAQLDIPEYHIEADGREAEVRRLIDAVVVAKAHLREIKNHIPPSTTTEIAGFIDTHILMLDDAAFSDEPARLIRAEGYNAEWAVKIQRDALVAVFDEMDDAYLRTRRDDVDHVVERILRNLLRHAPLRHEVPDQRLAGMIVLARDLTPADLVLLQHQGVGGFVTEYGGPTSHMAILARSMRIPGVVGLHHGRRYIKPEEVLIVDGDNGVVVGEADARILEQYQARKQQRDDYLAGLQVLRDAPTRTADSTRIILNANVELPEDIAAVIEAGGEGIGLYRTEFLFMNRPDYPTEDEHFETYRGMQEELAGLPITIRTADLGADKQFDQNTAGMVQTNPALGLRAVRLCLREPALFSPQLRAIIRASAFGPIRMMLPMLTSISEVEQVMQIVDDIRAEFRREGIPFDSEMLIGGMIEVPAAAVCADLFADALDFLSIGTNDLIQYSLAIDRVNDEVNYLYDPINPGVLRLVSATIDAGMAASKPVAMCGEMAGDSRYTRLLLGLGLSEFSVHPAALLEVKDIIRRTDLAQARAIAREAPDPCVE